MMFLPKSCVDAGHLAVRAQQPLEQLGIEDVDAHRGERHVGPPGHGLRIGRLLEKAQHARLVSTVTTPNSARSLARHLDDANGDVRFLLDVIADHRTVIHLVDVIARQHEHVHRPMLANDLHVLPQRVRGAAIPVLAALLLRRMMSTNSPNSPRR
jgi:hypothetical protein